MAGGTACLQCLPLLCPPQYTATRIRLPLLTYTRPCTAFSCRSGRPVQRRGHPHEFCAGQRIASSRPLRSCAVCAAHGEGAGVRHSLRVVTMHYIVEKPRECGEVICPALDCTSILRHAKPRSRPASMPAPLPCSPAAAARGHQQAERRGHLALLGQVPGRHPHLPGQLHPHLWACAAAYARH